MSTTITANVHVSRRTEFRIRRIDDFDSERLTLAIRDKGGLGTGAVVFMDKCDAIRLLDQLVLALES